MEAALTAWFGSVEVVRNGGKAIDPQRRLMFGYHPHGLFPIGMRLSAQQLLLGPVSHRPRNND